MNSIEITWKSRNFLTIILFLQFIACFTMIFDVPVARQVVGFVYFTFVPGFVIIKLLKLDALDGLETFVFSLGLSVAFLMLAGLLINAIGPVFGITEPLSFLPLMIILNGLILIGGVLTYLRNEGSKLWEAKTFSLHPSALLLLGLPVLSVVGAICSNAYNNNLILLGMMILISSLFAITVISKKILPPRLYPLCIFVIAISLLYHSSLISNNLIHFGSDVPGEYFAFKMVEKNAYWSLVNPYLGDSSVGRTYAMLSVTILPSIYSILLNLNHVWVFKVLYPAIFSLVPLVLYKVWSRFVGSKYAFISAFFFMTYQTFYTEMLGLNKQMIGELFFVLLLLVILNKKMKPVHKTACFLIFSLAFIVSHYALAEIFLFFVSFSLISLIIFKKPSRNITLSIIVYFLVIMFSWYIFTSSSSVFDSFLDFGQHVYNQLDEFFNPQSRGTEILRGLGLEASPAVWNTISRAFAYLTELLIFIGFVGIIMKRKRMRFEKEYFMLIIIAMAFLAALVLVPGLANTLNMTRFYHILLFFIAPLCVTGAVVIIELVFKRKDELRISFLLLIVLVPYFLFQTGFIYEVTQSKSWSVPLSKYRMSQVRLYTEFGDIDACSIFGAQWVSKNVVIGYTQIYADDLSRRNELRAYGEVYTGYVEVLSNVTNVAAGGIVHLSPLNVMDGIVVGSLVWNLSELQFLQDLNKIYSNGGSEVYKNVP
jgi:uncharacterized membrane protein